MTSISSEANETRTEHQILRDLVAKWVRLASEYAQGARDVRGIYVYVSSEEGERYANVFFEQGEGICYPDDLRGELVKPGNVLPMQKLLVADLREAQAEFAEIGVPLPTEYRVYFEPETGKLDVQISHEIKYAHHPTKTSSHGPEDWLDRLPKVYGKYLPTDGQ